jgi:hypothetical protein
MQAQLMPNIFIPKGLLFRYKYIYSRHCQISIGIKNSLFIPYIASSHMALRDDVLDRTDIVDLVSKYVQIKKVGKNRV